MDNTEEIPLSALHSYYMHRGIPGPGTGIPGSVNINPLPSANLSFQSTTETSSILPTLSVNPLFTGSLRGTSIGAPLPLRRKRGRPRKYGLEGALSLLSSSSLSTHTSTSTLIQKRRGRPPGIGKKQNGGWQFNSSGVAFTPHIIAISVGEDIMETIMAFCDQGSRSICILSANGAVSTAILHQPSISGATVTYEGRFDILCLSGSFLFTDNVYRHGKSGDLSVSLASHDGRVIGGRVGGALIAATSIQVIVGSFLCDNSRTKEIAKENLEIAHHQINDNLVNPC